ncbi:hypothetical protein GMSM_35690 [Geomonas sp. Red276]
MVLFVGRLAEDTGIRQYLSAWQSVSAEFPSYKLIICGDGVLKEWVTSFVAEHNLNVELQGFVHDVDSYLARACVVFTSGYLGILEAFSYSNAVIALYDNPLKKDYLELMPGSEKMMWIAGDNEELQLCMREALAGGSSKPEVGKAFADEHDWSAVKRTYYRLWAKG